MKTIANHLILATLCLGMGACAATMPLQRGMSDVDTSQKSVLVARVRVRYASFSIRPVVKGFVVTSQGRDQRFGGPTLLSVSSEKGDDYFVSADVVPGKTDLNSIEVVMAVFPGATLAWVPLGYRIDVASNKLIYLGNIDLVFAERTDLGPVPTAVGVALIGVARYKLGVNITDALATDGKDLVATFPGLGGKEIVRNVLPNRPAELAGVSVSRDAMPGAPLAVYQHACPTEAQAPPPLPHSPFEDRPAEPDPVSSYYLGGEPGPLSLFEFWNPVVDGKKVNGLRVVNHWVEGTDDHFFAYSSSVSMGWTATENVFTGQEFVLPQDRSKPGVRRNYTGMAFLDDNRAEGTVRPTGAPDSTCPLVPVKQ